jgi:large subunit ribosomal protein L23
MRGDIHIYDVLRRPVITEKSTQMGEELRQYVFEVHSKANKIQIKEAVEIIFEKRVRKVRTMIMPAKRGRRGRNYYLRTKEWKKAIVTLEDGEGEIELFNV